MILAEKIERKFFINQEDFVSIRELLMSIIYTYYLYIFQGINQPGIPLGMPYPNLQPGMCYPPNQSGIFYSANQPGMHFPVATAYSYPVYQQQQVQLQYTSCKEIV